MKFNNIIYDLVTEEFANKQLLKTMIGKWYGETPTEPQKTEGNFLLEKFFELKNRLNVNLPEIKTFLNRYDTFNKNNIKEVSQYSLPQVKFIVGEFFEIGTPEVDDGLPEILKGRNLSVTKERIESSQSMWFSSSNSNLVINAGGLRVYEILNRRDSIAFGFYQGSVARSSYFENEPYKSQWCTVKENENSNLYGAYRERRTFYFVIDESKNPEVQTDTQISQYFLSALQASSDSETGFRITTILNAGIDRVITEQEIFNIYPQLRDQLDKIVKVPYSQEELGIITDNLDLVNENDSNSNAFFRSPTSMKKRYIDSGKPITKEKSWESMSDSLKTAYFDITIETTIYERFSTKELLDKIRQRQSEFNSIDRRLKILGLTNGFLDVYNKSMADFYIVDQIKSLFHDGSTSLYQDRRTSLYGLYNKSKADWVTKDGVKYEPNYRKIGVNMYSSDGKNFSCKIYGVGGNIDNRSFYVLTPIGGDNLVDGYFVTSDRWTELKEKENLIKDSEGQNTFDSENDVDLQEKEKGI